MDVTQDWDFIRRHFNRSFRTNFHVSIALVGPDNRPTVTPIGSLFLNDDQSGFYFEKFPSRLPAHARTNRSICVLGVNSGTWFWLKSLFRGKFESCPAIKLYGELGERRRASDSEVRRLNRRMGTTRGLKGNTYLWGEMNVVRKITFTHADKINLGAMTAHL
jgi:hypothetical protein